MSNIAYISTEFPPRMFGGLGAYTLDMTRMLTKMGHSVTVYTPNDNATLPFREVIDGINVVRPQSYSDSDVMGQFLSEDTKNRWGEGGIEFLSDLLSYNRRSAELILDEIKTNPNPVDVCVGHDWLALPALIMIKRHSTIPTVYHVHSTEIGRSLGDINWQIRNLEIQGAHTAHRVITVSNAMKDQLVEMGAPADKISVCYNAVDHTSYDPSKVSDANVSALRAEYGISPEHKVILFIGRLEEVKGAYPLVQSIKTVINEQEGKTNGKKVHLIVVGRGVLEGAIRETIESEGLSDYVTLNTGFLDLPLKLAHLKLADICVFPSLYEPFGIVALEAMAMETPLIVGAKGTSGLREIVITPPSEDACGMHVDPANPLDIAWAINHILEIDENEVKRWGINGRKRVLDMFTWEHIAQQTLGVYKSIKV